MRPNPRPLGEFACAGRCRARARADAREHASLASGPVLAAVLPRRDPGFPRYDRLPMFGERTRSTRARAARATRAFGASLLLPALALAIAACGSSSQHSKGIDPASLAPAATPVYVGAEVRPEEPLRADARAVAQALTREPDPYVRLLALLQTPGSPKLD